MYSLANTLANVDSEGRFDIELTFAIDIYMNEHHSHYRDTYTQRHVCKRIHSDMYVNVYTATFFM